MFSKYSPASMLIALNKENIMYLGIQNNFVADVGKEKVCKILGGCQQEYEVIRPTDDLKVIKIKGGVIFPGYFPHCGIQNYGDNSEESETISSFLTAIAHKNFTNILSSMKNIENLDSICCLFCSIQPIKKIHIMKNKKMR